jgi:ubiquinone biosynthesis protein
VERPRFLVTIGKRRSRQREIAEILGRHGLGFFMGIAGLDRFVPFHRRLFGHARRDTPYTRPEHVRMAFEELGTTFIKFGQILSTRADLLPPAYQAELARLQDHAPSIPIEVVRETIVREFGRPAEELFAEFDPQPLAVGSIGQAHVARLADGTEVVVKVRRPGVVEQVDEDLRILADLAQTADRRWEAATQIDLPGLVSEFGRTLRAELDFLAERTNAERFAAMFSGDMTMASRSTTGPASRMRASTAGCSRSMRRMRCSRWCSRNGSSMPIHIPGTSLSARMERLA